LFKVNHQATKNTPVEYASLSFGIQRGKPVQTGFTGFFGFSIFFPFPEEKEKENPPAAEGPWLLTPELRTLYSPS